jgi:hypothetical protein
MTTSKFAQAISYLREFLKAIRRVEGLRARVERIELARDDYAHAGQNEKALELLQPVASYST